MITPALALAFTTASLDPRVTFTRSGDTATVVNSAGYVAPINANLPRFDYNPATLVPRGLLIEESRTNLITYSATYSNPAWNKARASVSTNSVLSPDGGTSSFSLIEDTSTGTHFVRQIKTVVSGSTYTVWAYVRANTRTWCAVTIAAGSGYHFNLGSGAVGSVVSGVGTVSNPFITAVGNGWYRCGFTVVAGNTTGGVDIYLASGDNGFWYTGNGSSGIYIWGSQIELGSFATSYTPTGASAVTRNSDIATITGTNFSGFWRATRGGVLVRARQNITTGTRPWIQLDDGTADNVIALRGNATNPELYIKATTDQAQIDAGTIAANTSYRLAATWNTDDCSAKLNDDAPVLDSSAIIPTVNQMRLGSDGTNYLNGWLETLDYCLTDADLQLAATSAGRRGILRSMINPVL